MGKKFNLGHLNEEECEQILRVVQRDFELRQKEKERLAKVQAEVEEEAKRSTLLSKTPFNENSCIICFAPFRFLLNPKIECVHCNRFHCKNCVDYFTPPPAEGSKNDEKQVPVCKLCQKQRDLQLQSNSWFYTNIRERFKRFGSAKVVRSLYKRRSGSEADDFGELALASDAASGFNSEPFGKQPRGGVAQLFDIEIERSTAVPQSNTSVNAELRLSGAASIEDILDETQRGEGTLAHYRQRMADIEKNIQQFYHDNHIGNHDREDQPEDEEEYLKQVQNVNKLLTGFIKDLTAHLGNEPDSREGEGERTNGDTAVLEKEAISKQVLCASLRHIYNSSTTASQDTQGDGLSSDINMNSAPPPLPLCVDPDRLSLDAYIERLSEAIVDNIRSEVIIKQEEEEEDEEEEAAMRSDLAQLSNRATLSQLAGNDSDLDLQLNEASSLDTSRGFSGNELEATEEFDQQSARPRGRGPHGSDVRPTWNDVDLDLITTSANGEPWSMTRVEGSQLTGRRLPYHLPDTVKPVGMFLPRQQNGEDANMYDNASDLSDQSDSTLDDLDVQKIDVNDEGSKIVDGSTQTDLLSMQNNLEQSRAVAQETVEQRGLEHNVSEQDGIAIDTVDGAKTLPETTSLLKAEDDENLRDGRRNRMSLTSEMYDDESSCTSTDVEGEGEPRFVRLPKHVRVRPGAAMRNHCSLSGTRPIDVFWYRDSIHLVQLDHDDRCSVSHKGHTYSVELSDLSDSDSGHYLCIGVNEHGHCQHRFNVLVTDQPDGESQKAVHSGKILEGSAMTSEQNNATLEPYLVSKMDQLENSGNPATNTKLSDAENEAMQSETRISEYETMALEHKIPDRKHETMTIDQKTPELKVGSAKLEQRFTFQPPPFKREPVLMDQDLSELKRETETKVNSASESETSETAEPTVLDLNSDTVENERTFSERKTEIMAGEERLLKFDLMAENRNLPEFLNEAFISSATILKTCATPTTTFIAEPLPNGNLMAMEEKLPESIAGVDALGIPQIDEVQQDRAERKRNRSELETEVKRLLRRSESENGGGRQSEEVLDEKVDNGYHERPAHGAHEEALSEDVRLGPLTLDDNDLPKPLLQRYKRDYVVGGGGVDRGTNDETFGGAGREIANRVVGGTVGGADDETGSRTVGERIDGRISGNVTETEGGTFSRTNRELELKMPEKPINVKSVNRLSSKSGSDSSSFSQQSSLESSTKEAIDVPLEREIGFVDARQRFLLDQRNGSRDLTSPRNNMRSPPSSAAVRSPPPPLWDSEYKPVELREKTRRADDGHPILPTFPRLQRTSSNQSTTSSSTSDVFETDVQRLSGGPWYTGTSTPPVSGAPQELEEIDLPSVRELASRFSGIQSEDASFKRVHSLTARTRPPISASSNRFDQSQITEDSLSKKSPTSRLLTPDERSRTLPSRSISPLAQQSPQQSPRSPTNQPSPRSEQQLSSLDKFQPKSTYTQAAPTSYVPLYPPPVNSSVYSRAIKPTEKMSGERRPVDRHQELKVRANDARFPLGDAEAKIRPFNSPPAGGTESKPSMSDDGF